MKKVKKIRGLTFWKPRCPECNRSEFTVFPFVTPELVKTFFDNGDVVTRLEDYCEDYRDELCCSNCGWEGKWEDCDHRRNSE